MKEIFVYESVDGKIFRNEKEAIKHDKDCIGELIDKILTTASEVTKGHITRNDIFKMSIHLIENLDRVKREINKLSMYIEEMFGEEDE